MDTFFFVIIGIAYIKIIITNFEAYINSLQYSKYTLENLEMSV